jgi:hypothetical protein
MDMQVFQVKDRKYTIRPAQVGDAVQLVEVRLQIDGETENMDREKGGRVYQRNRI